MHIPKCKLFVHGRANHCSKVDDIGEVADSLSDEECSNTPKIITGEITGVLSAEEYVSCISCKTKV